MAYDVFLVSANEDRDTAKLIARRLRALKLKVWFNQKQVDETFDAKDARNATNSTSMLVLWSENAVKSDWVRAAASVGHSRPGTLVQIALDKTIPYEPFRTAKRFSVAGMTSRKTPDGFYQAIEVLGSRDGRSDLREWMGFGSKDEDERADWLAEHPSDPLALHAKAQREKDCCARCGVPEGGLERKRASLGCRRDDCRRCCAPLCGTCTGNRCGDWNRLGDDGRNLPCHPGHAGPCLVFPLATHRARDACDVASCRP
jgi:hypothetical protein